MNILLADDDMDDCILFQDALKEVCKESTLVIAKNGQVLMEMLLAESFVYPDAIFLDLNMPRKNGIECLEEIRKTEKLHSIPVVIFSTTAQQITVNSTYEKGANYYIQKPATFVELKSVIKKVLSKNWKQESGQPTLEDFVLQPDLA